MAGTAAEADAAVEAGKLVAVTDYRIVTEMNSIDVMLESTGVPEIGARAALRSARNGQDLAMMNVETDITVGPDPALVRAAEGRALRAGRGRRTGGLQGALRPRRGSMGFTIVAAGKGKNNPLDRHATPTDPACAKGGCPARPLAPTC